MEHSNNSRCRGRNVAEQDASIPALEDRTFRRCWNVPKLEISLKRTPVILTFYRVIYKVAKLKSLRKL